MGRFSIQDAEGFVWGWSAAHAGVGHGVAKGRDRRAQQVAGEDAAVMMSHGCKRSFLLLMSWFAIF
jgi:hypothetical protein